MKEITINIPGFTLAAKTWGNPHSPLILALHGWLDNANSFLPLAPYLQDKYYLVAVDLPGHGHSSHLPAGCNYHFFDSVFVIIELMHALNAEKVHLLGHSMGACIASLMGGVTPELLHSIYLIEALGPFSAPAATACQQLANYAHERKQLQIKHKSRGYSHYENMVEARAAKGYVSLEIAKMLCARGVMEQDGRFHWRHDRRLMISSPLRMSEEQVLSCLHKINLPIQLLLSKDGFAFNADIMENRIRSVKNMELILLAGGHHIHMEQPEAVGQLLTDFYKTL